MVDYPILGVVARATRSRARAPGAGQSGCRRASAVTSRSAHGAWAARRSLVRRAWRASLPATEKQTAAVGVWVPSGGPGDCVGPASAARRLARRPIARSHTRSGSGRTRTAVGWPGRCLWRRGCGLRRGRDGDAAVPDRVPVVVLRSFARPHGARCTGGPERRHDRSPAAFWARRTHPFRIRSSHHRPKLPLTCLWLLPGEHRLFELIDRVVAAFQAQPPQL